MFNDMKENKILDDFKAICNKLDNYDKVNTLINRKIELTFKILKSNLFKQSIYSFGINNPEDIISIYKACKSEDGFLITYGTTILSGMYLDFCSSFLTTTNKRYIQKYNITNLKTREEVSISLNDIIEYYTSKELSDFKVDIPMKSNDNNIVMPLVSNDYVISNNNIKYGVIKIDPIVKSVLSGIIEELFSITVTELSTIKIEDSFESIETLDNVVPLFG